eukprot:gene16327-22522_t
MVSRLQFAVLAFALVAVDIFPGVGIMVSDPCASCNAEYCPDGGCMWEVQSVACTGTYTVAQVMRETCLNAGYKSFINGAIPGYCYNQYEVTSVDTTMHAMCWRVY